MFETEVIVNESMVDKAGRLKLSCLLRFQQGICEQHTEKFGLPSSVIREQLGLAFVFTKIRVNTYRLPGLNEKIVVTTWCSELKGVRFTRNFRVTLQDTGELLTESKAEITVIDLNTRKLIRPASVPEFDMFLYNETEPNGCDYPQKLPAEVEAYNNVLRQITEADIDNNNHVNNTVYADMVTETLADEYLKINPSVFEINYLHEAFLNETMKINLSKIEQGVLVVGSVGDKQSFAAKIIYK